MRFRAKKRYLLIAISLMMLFGCKNSNSTGKQESDDLLSYGDSTLTLQTVLASIPPGLDPADSIRLFNSIVDNWLQDMLLEDVASEEIADIEKINRMVKDYRRRLIITEYKRRLGSRAPGAVKDDEIRKYYDIHSSEFILENPVVKGVFIKLSATSDQKNQIRRWMAEGSTTSVDKIEKNGMRTALQYDNFMNEWQDWENVRSQMPYRFPSDKAWHDTINSFETEYSGSYYILRLTDYLDAGSVMPYDFAAPLIRQILETENSASAETELVNTLIKNALQSGKLKPGLFDPIKHKNNEIKEK
jgi:hypothetical protein